MATPRQQLHKRRQGANLQSIFLHGGVAHVSPTVTIQELLHSSPNIEDATLQQRIKQASESFTDKHKEVMDTLRQETMCEEVNFDDALHILEAPSRPQTSSPSVKEKHSTKCNAIESQVFLGKNTSAASITSTTNLTYDYMSGVWRMLQTERESEEFMITPKGFEFDVEKTKWVPKSEAVVVQIQESKQKCEEWLTKKCDLDNGEKPSHASSKKLPRILPIIKKNRNKLT